MIPKRDFVPINLAAAQSRASQWIRGIFIPLTYLTQTEVIRKGVQPIGYKEFCEIITNSGRKTENISLFFIKKIVIILYLVQ